MPKKILVLTSIILSVFACKNSSDNLAKSSDSTLSNMDSSKILSNEANKRISDEEKNTLDDALKQYKKFLVSKATAKVGEESYTIKSLVYENSSEVDEVKYSLFDMNGDGVPELHIRTPRFYDIFTYRKGEIVIWYEASVYSEPLNNGAIGYMRSGGAPTHIDYQYTILDFYGKEIYNATFSKYTETDSYDENGVYILEGIKLSKKDWNAQTKKYLSVKSNQIIWHALNKDGNKH